MLKSLTEKYVFRHPTLIAQQEGQCKIVGEVWKCLYEASEENGERFELIPVPFRDEIRTLRQEASEPDRKRARVVSDVIASMTEKQLINLYENINGHAPSSVRERIID